MLSIMTLTHRMLEETRTQPEDIDGIINYARRIEDVRVAALIHELSRNGQAPATARREYHVSLRSDGSVDVARISARYGGGGHASAAGFSIETTLSELRTEMLKLSEMIPELCVVN
jgi:phosphoesterase RecJ-like protein